MLSLSLTPFSTMTIDGTLGHAPQTAAKPRTVGDGLNFRSLLNWDLALQAPLGVN